MKNYLTLIVLLFSASVSGLSVEVGPGERECFLLSSTTEGTPCYGNYEIISPNPEPMVISVVGPAPGRKEYSYSKYSGEGALTADATEGSFAFDTEADGDYKFCIANGTPNENDKESKLVAFNFRCMKNLEEADYESAGLENELLELSQGLNFLKDHLKFMNQREHVHAESLGSINSTVLVWTVCETLVLVGLVMWQVTYISKFFETRRKI